MKQNNKLSIIAILILFLPISSFGSSFVLAENDAKELAGFKKGTNYDPSYDVDGLKFGAKTQEMAQGNLEKTRKRAALNPAATAAVLKPAIDKQQKEQWQEKKAAQNKDAMLQELQKKAALKELQQKAAFFVQEPVDTAALTIDKITAAKIKADKDKAKKAQRRLKCREKERERKEQEKLAATQDAQKAQKEADLQQKMLNDRRKLLQLKKEKKEADSEFKKTQLQKLQEEKKERESFYLKGESIIESPDKRLAESHRPFASAFTVRETLSCSSNLLREVDLGFSKAHEQLFEISFVFADLLRCKSVAGVKNSSGYSLVVADLKKKIQSNMQVAQKNMIDLKKSGQTDSYPYVFSSRIFIVCCNCLSMIK